LTIVAGKGTEELQGLNVVRIEESRRNGGIGHRFDHHAINDVAISTKPVETG